MRKVTEELVNFLTISPKARERKNKDEAFAFLLQNKYPYLKSIERTVLAQLFREYTNYDREWRNLLMRKPELRGVDYPKKAQLEKERKMELGYNID